MYLQLGLDEHAECHEEREERWPIITPINFHVPPLFGRQRPEAREVAQSPSNRAGERVEEVSMAARTSN